MLKYKCDINSYAVNNATQKCDQIQTQFYAS